MKFDQSFANMVDSPHFWWVKIWGFWVQEQLGLWNEAFWWTFLKFMLSSEPILQRSGFCVKSPFTQLLLTCSSDWWLYCRSGEMYRLVPRHVPGPKQSMYFAHICMCLCRSVYICENIQLSCVYRPVCVHVCELSFCSEYREYRTNGLRYIFSLEIMHPCEKHPGGSVDYVDAFLTQ